MSQSSTISRLKEWFGNKMLHSILVGIFFVVFQLKYSFILYPWLHTVTMLILVVLVTFIFTPVLYLFFWNRKKAALMSTITFVAVLFFDNIRFGIYQLVHLPYGAIKFIILGVWIIIFIFMLKTKSTLKTLNAYFNVAFLVLVAFELVQGSIFYFQKHQWVKYAYQQPVNPQTTQPVKDTVGLPNIYHIVLDAYTSSEELKTNYNYNNSELDSFLLKKGFYLANKAKSNSTATQISMATEFNMDYLPDLDSLINNDVVSTSVYRLIIKQSQVHQKLKTSGYEIANLSIFDIQDQKRYTDMVLMPDANHLPRFLFRDCLFKLSGKKKYPPVSGQANLQTFSTIEKQTHSSNSPKYVYGHLMMPHGPYYFDRTGKYYEDGKGMPGNTVKQNYLEQLIYTNQLLLHCVDQILMDSLRPSVIIIQGDHGSRLLRNEGNQSEEFSMYSAFYFSDRDYSTLYDSISPVNFYRIIFNKYWGADYSILEDKRIKSTLHSH